MNKCYTNNSNQMNYVMTETPKIDGLVVRLPYTETKRNLVIDGLLYGLSHGQEIENREYVDDCLAKMGRKRDPSQSIGEDDENSEFVVHLLPLPVSRPT